MMKRMSILFFALVLTIASCKKLEKTDTSFTMTYDGQTYTEVDEQSLIMTFGTIAIIGDGDTEFALTLEGVGEDGTTTNLCTDPNDCVDICRTTLDFGAVEGKEAFVGLSGTIKRTGKKLEVDVSGLTVSGEAKSLTATIVVGTII